MGKQNKLFKVYIFNVISKLALIMESQSTYKSLTALEIFVQICRDEHKKRFPDDVIALTEFVKQCSERWKRMTEEEKRRFKQMEEQDKERWKYPARHQPLPTSHVIDKTLEPTNSSSNEDKTIEGESEN